MSRDLEQLLRDTAVTPRQAPDPTDLVAAGRRRRLRRKAASAVAGVAAAVLVGVGVFQVLPTGSEPQILDEPPADPAPAEPAPDEAVVEESAPAEPSPEPSPTTLTEPATFVTLPPGRQPSLLVDGEGGLAVVHGWRQAQQFTEFEDMDVAISRCLDVTCDDVTTTVVASGAELYGLIADLGADGAPVIGFTDWANERAVLLICEAAECATPVRRAVDGGVVDVAVSPEGNPVLAYKQDRPGAPWDYWLGLLLCGDAACATFTEVLLDMTEFDGFFGGARIGFDEGGAPFVVHQDGRWLGEGMTDMQSGVFVSACLDAVCSEYSTPVLVAEDTNLVDTDPAADAPLFLVRAGDHLEIVRCPDVPCATPVVTRLEADESLGEWPGAFVSGPGGAPVALVPVGPDLQVLACQDASCSARTASVIPHDSDVHAVAASVLPGGELLVVTSTATEEGAPSAPMQLATCPGADCS